MDDRQAVVGVFVLFLLIIGIWFLIDGLFDFGLFLIIPALLIIIYYAKKSKEDNSSSYTITTNKESNSQPPRQGWTEYEREQVRISQKGMCNMCKKPPPRWEYHHIDKDRSNNSILNCEGLCPNCHSVKTHG